MTYFHEYLLDDPDSRVHQATYTHVFFIHLPVVKVAVFSWWACCLFTDFQIFRLLLSKFLWESWRVEVFFVSGLLDGKFFTDQGGPFLVELVGNHGKLWRTHAHTHTLSPPVLSLTSLNWREDWLQFESGIQSGIIKFDISLSTSTVSGSYLMKEN